MYWTCRKRKTKTDLCQIPTSRSAISVNSYKSATAGVTVFDRLLKISLQGLGWSCFFFSYLYTIQFQNVATKVWKCFENWILWTKKAKGLKFTTQLTLQNIIDTLSSQSGRLWLPQTLSVCLCACVFLCLCDCPSFTAYISATKGRNLIKLGKSVGTWVRLIVLNFIKFSLVMTSRSASVDVVKQAQRVLLSVGTSIVIRHTHTDR